MRGRPDRGPHASEHLRYVLGVHVAPLARPRDAAQPRDRGAPVLGVLETNLDQRSGAPLWRGQHRPRIDVALLDEDPGELALEPGCGDLDGLMSGVDRVAHPREGV